MTLGTALARGTRGVTLTLPDTLHAVADEAGMVCAIDREQGLEWRVFHAPGLHLDLAAARRDHLVAEMRLHARKMFDDVGRLLDQRADHGLPPTLPDDFDPVVEVRDAVVDGAAALVLVHRMALRPGVEIVMGHLLVPLADGLFEARVTARDPNTGMRESALMMRALQTAPDRDPAAAMPTRAEIDAPAHDDLMPEHSLSRVRRALRWMTADAGLTVTRPAEPLPSPRIVSTRPPCAFTPPPRFVDTDAGLIRISFCATDGVAELRLAETEYRADDIADLAAREAAALWAGFGPMKTVCCQRGRAGRARVAVDGQGPIEGVRIAGVWFRAPGDAVCTLNLITTTALPPDHLFDELEATLDGLTWTEPGAEGR